MSFFRVALSKKLLFVLLLTSKSHTQQSILARASSSQGRPQFSRSNRATRNLSQHPNNHHHRHSLQDRSQDHALAILEGNHGSDALDHYREGSPGFLNGVVLVAATNLLINILRPDEAIMWQFRIPRILWEICLMFTATMAKFPGSAVSHTTSLVYLTLSTMLWTTALTDIFFWAPLFAFWSGMDNEDCSGGWFTGKKYTCVPNPNKGYGRLLVTLQSLYGGVFYLNFAIACWGEYVAHRDQLKAMRQARAFHSLRRHYHDM